MSGKSANEPVQVLVPHVSGEEAADATDLVEHLVEKYQIAPVDIDALFNAMAAIYIRGRMIFQDREPVFCSIADHISGGPAKRTG